MRCFKKLCQLWSASVANMFIWVQTHHFLKQNFSQKMSERALMHNNHACFVSFTSRIWFIQQKCLERQQWSMVRPPRIRQHHHSSEKATCRQHPEVGPFSPVATLVKTNEIVHFSGWNIWNPDTNAWNKMNYQTLGMEFDGISQNLELLGVIIHNPYHI